MVMYGDDLWEENPGEDGEVGDEVDDSHMVMMVMMKMKI